MSDTDVTPVLRAENISISFNGVKSLRGVDVTVQPGQIVCIAGENGCGKSTFVKIVSGVYSAETGEVYINGELQDPLTPRTAIAAGVQVIYQDLALFEHLTVAENIAFSRSLHEGQHLVNRKKMRQIAAEQLTRIGVELDTETPVSQLSIANKQIVAICRALSMDARILFMDEPTTALTSKEVDRLLQIVLDLKARGLSVVFISHKLDEVFKIADSITIFRDGQKVGDFAASELDERKLSYYMTGREITYARYHRTLEDTEPILEIQNLAREGNYRNITFSVLPGDIVGLTGLLGAGRTELALSLFGLNRPDSGQIIINGKSATATGPWDALKNGIALVPEDRHTQGLFNTQTVAHNISSTSLSNIIGRFGNIRSKKERSLAQHTVNDMAVNNKNIDTVVGKLSGGNQQKVVIGKWIATAPRLLILDSPTVGIDIGSKEEIYGKIHALADSGVGVIFISDEPEEIIANCNRVLVMHEGDVLDTFEEEDMRAADFKSRLARIIANPELSRVREDETSPTEVAQ